MTIVDAVLRKHPVGHAEEELPLELHKVKNKVSTYIDPEGSMVESDLNNRTPLIIGRIRSKDYALF